MAAALMAASILVSGLGSGAAEAQQSSVTKPLSAVTFEGAPLSQTDGDVSAPALADLAPDATLDLLVRLDAPSLYQVLDQVETNTAALQDASVPMSLDAISSIHNTLKQGQEDVYKRQASTWSRATTSSWGPMSACPPNICASRSAAASAALRPRNAAASSSMMCARIRAT